MRSKPVLLLLAVIGLFQAWRTPVAWAQCEVAKLTSLPDGTDVQGLGHSVALDGDAAILGAPFSACESGEAHVYRFDGVDWVFEQALTASDGVAGDQFGVSVAVSGDAAFVGAPMTDNGSTLR